KLTTIAEKCRTLVESSSLELDQGAVKVTLSIGGTLAREKDTAGTVIKRVDELMYHSKNNGRNLVTIDD
ncbi:MAG: diguanylate cyclase, partial [bacterium]|nr:diguanylate cyclase [bacterium]